MSVDGLYLISEQPDFTPHIGRLVSMMNYARATTLRAVKDLRLEQLDFVPSGFKNSIGALLEFPFKAQTPANHHWCWFHVFEDEISHRGQIRLIRQNSPK